MQALEKPLGLPSLLLSRAEEVRQHNGIAHLHQTVKNTEKLKENDRAIYYEGVEILRAEAADDENARRKYGTERWKRAGASEAAPKLYSQIHEIENYFKSAEQSDQIVLKKLKENEKRINLLCGTTDDLETFVPSSRRTERTEKVEKAIAGIRSRLYDVSRAEAQRQRKIDNIKLKAKHDDISE